MSHVADLDILADEEADRRRVVEEQELAQYIAVVRQKEAEAERAYEEERRARIEKLQQEAIIAMASGLNAQLGLEVPVERVRIVETGDFGQWHPEVLFAGVWFAKPYVNSSGMNYREREEIHISRPCADCGAPVWVLASSPTLLVQALRSTEHRHDHACRQQFDEDGEPITDRFGNPPEPRTPVLSTEERHRQAVARYTSAVRTRRTIEAQKPIAKREATKRLVGTENELTGKPHSASSAEAIVETDPQYATFLALYTDAVIEEIEAKEALYLARPILVGEDAA